MYHEVMVAKVWRQELLDQLEGQLPMADMTAIEQFCQKFDEGVTEHLGVELLRMAEQLGQMAGDKTAQKNYLSRRWSWAEVYIPPRPQAPKKLGRDGAEYLSAVSLRCLGLARARAKHCVNVCQMAYPAWTEEDDNE